MEVMTPNGLVYRGSRKDMDEEEKRWWSELKEKDIDRYNSMRIAVRQHKEWRKKWNG